MPILDEIQNEDNLSSTNCTEAKYFELDIHNIIINVIFKIVH